MLFGTASIYYSLMSYIWAGCAGKDPNETNEHAGHAREEDEADEHVLGHGTGRHADLPFREAKPEEAPVSLPIDWLKMSGFVAQICDFESTASAGVTTAFNDSFKRSVAAMTQAMENFAFHL